VGETISCETCLHWYHFNCVGVTHSDDCVVKEDVPYFCPSCNEQERRAKKAKKQQQQLQQQQTSQAAASAAAGKSPRQPSSSSSQPLQNQVITGSKSKINRRSPEKEAVRKNILIGNSTPSKVVNSQSNTSKKTSGSSRGGRISPKDEGNIEEEMNLAIEEVKRKGGTSSPGVVVAVERLPTVNTSIEGYSAIPTNNPWDSLNHIEEVVVEKEVEMEEDSEEEEQEEEFSNSEVKIEPVKKMGESVTGLQEEEAWLQAVESGNLQQVYSCDSELRSVREPSQLTARQRALGGEDGGILSQLEFGSRAKDKVASELTEEEKNVKAMKRKEIETEKRERQKQKTMDTLLKKKDSKATKQIKTSKSNRSDIPKISYVANSSGALLSLPEGFEYPMEASSCRLPPAVISCTICPNPKKYNSSATGSPVCSLACYKTDLARCRA